MTIAQALPIEDYSVGQDLENLYEISLLAMVLQEKIGPWDLC